MDPKANTKKLTKTIIILFLSSFSLAPSAHSVGAINMSEILKGRILLQVESKGEAWYVNPADNKRYYMGRPDDAFVMMKDLGVGISNANLKRIRVANPDLSEDDDKVKIDTDFSRAQKGKILLQVEQNGEAWYVNPADNKRYFLGRPQDAFNAMKDLGLGILNENLNKIPAYFDDDWSLYNDFLFAVYEKNIDALDSATYYDYSGFFNKYGEDTGWAVIKEAQNSFGNLEKSDITKVYKDYKQSILSTEVGQNDSGYNIKQLFFIKNKEKGLFLGCLNLIQNNEMSDSDEDGRLDDDEDCTYNLYDHFPEKCIETDPSDKDSDNDGWWDGIEVRAETDPNDPASHPQI